MHANSLNANFHHLILAFKEDRALAELMPI